jgi:LacI family transcriptional regulator
MASYSVTSRDIAAHAGVSQSTVSRALRDDPRVAPETAARVRESVARLGYMPNTAARSLITRRTNTIGVIVAGITNPFYPELLDVLHDEFSLSGYRTVLLNERTGGRSVDAALPQLQDRSVDGLVFVSATLGSPFPAHFQRKGIPVVLLNREIDADDLDRVVSDNVGGGRLAADALVDLGHRRVALLSGPRNTSTARDREGGFLARLRERGVEVDERMVRRGEYSHQSGYQGCLELLEAAPRPTAVFCANDVVAFGALDAARRLGVAVPDELSVIGYDDVEMAGWEAFRLTTVRQPLRAMSRRAGRLLIEPIEGDPDVPGRREVFPAGLVQRSTTSPAPDAV